MPNEERRPVAQHQFRILGILNKLYVLMENAEGLVLVDQHAAHERILFEELRRRMEEKGVPSQRLLLPQVIELAPRDAEWIERNLATLQKMGLGVEEFGRHTFKLESLPPFLSGAEPARLLQDVIDSLKSAEQQQFAAAPGRGNDREDRLPARGQGERSVCAIRKWKS